MKKPRPQSARTTQAQGPIAVDPRWLLKAGLVMLAVAFVCGYATLCWLFYQGQWQLVLHPVKTAERPATIAGLPYEVLRFGPDSSGIPQRTAWWMAPAAGDAYRHLVVLYLPSGDGSLKDATATLDGLRRLGIAVFAMNYRGYGESLGDRPDEATMREDAEAAWRYVVQERGMSGNDVIPFGAGVGASLAMGLVRAHAEILAVILDAPRFDVLQRVKADPRVRFLPVDRLLHDRFALEPMLAESRTPKLIFSHAAAESKAIAQAGEPKITVEMTQIDEGLFAKALRRFLDAYAPPTPAVRLQLNPVAPTTKTPAAATSPAGK